IGSAFADAASGGPLLLGLLAAAAAGIVSFASPCVVPLVPGCMSSLAGLVGGQVEFKDNQPVVTKKRQLAVVGAALLFFLFFTVVFVLATVSVFGAISLLIL